MNSSSMSTPLSSAQVWVANSQKDVSSFRNGNIIFNYFAVSIAVLILYHSHSINRKRRRNIVQTCTEISAITLCFNSIFVIVASARKDNIILNVSMYDFFAMGLFTFVIQACDCYIFLSRLQAIRTKLPVWEKFGILSFFWIILVGVWLPTFTFVPAFYNTNSPSYANIFGVLRVLYFFGMISFNAYFTLQSFRIVGRIWSRIGQQNRATISRRRSLSEQRSASVLGEGSHMVSLNGNLGRANSSIAFSGAQGELPQSSQAASGVGVSGISAQSQTCSISQPHSNIAAVAPGDDFDEDEAGALISLRRMHIVVMKTLGHGVSSFIAAILFTFAPDGIRYNIWKVIIVMGLHFWFNMKIERRLFPKPKDESPRSMNRLERERRARRKMEHDKKSSEIVNRGMVSFQGGGDGGILPGGGAVETRERPISNTNYNQTNQQHQQQPQVLNMAVASLNHRDSASASMISRGVPIGSAAVASRRNIATGQPQHGIIEIQQQQQLKQQQHSSADTRSPEAVVNYPQRSSGGVYPNSSAVQPAMITPGGGVASGRGNFGGTSATLVAVGGGGGSVSPRGSSNMVLGTGASSTPIGAAGSPRRQSFVPTLDSYASPKMALSPPGKRPGGGGGGARNNINPSSPGTPQRLAVSLTPSAGGGGGGLQGGGGGGPAGQPPQFGMGERALSFTGRQQQQQQLSGVASPQRRSDPTVKRPPAALAAFRNSSATSSPRGAINQQRQQHHNIRASAAAADDDDASSGNSNSNSPRAFPPLRGGFAHGSSSRSNRRGWTAAAAAAHDSQRSCSTSITVAAADAGGDGGNGVILMNNTTGGGGVRPVTVTVAVATADRQNAY